MSSHVYPKKEENVKSTACAPRHLIQFVFLAATAAVPGEKEEGVDWSALVAEAAAVTADADAEAVMGRRERKQQQPQQRQHEYSAAITVSNAATRKPTMLLEATTTQNKMSNGENARLGEIST